MPDEGVLATRVEPLEASDAGKDVFEASIAIVGKGSEETGGQKKEREKKRK